MKWLHQRWLPLLWVWYLIFPRKWKLFKGDSELSSKSEGVEWRTEWPWSVFIPTYKEGDPYNGLYFVFYKNVTGLPWGKVLPVRGQVALRLGDKDVTFTAVSLFGRSIHLEVRDHVITLAEVEKMSLTMA